MTSIAILLIALAAAGTVGMWWRARHGRARAGRGTDRTDLLTAVGLRHDGPTVLHFSADWCGPCAAVRRVVGQVIGEHASARELELDIDEHPTLARELGVLSLPTTFIFDADVTERFRIAGVPTAKELRSALASL